MGRSGCYFCEYNSVWDSAEELGEIVWENLHKGGKMQAELAALMYKKTRLIRMCGPSGRLGFGTSGEAEVLSARGRGNAGAGFISGAGETELQLQRRRLFATVDPRLRSVLRTSGRKVLVSDTVGFISDLPVQLVEAFHATLEEVVEADLLVHVLDCTAPNLEEHRSTVLQVLEQIGVSKEKLDNMIEVWNKIDSEEQDECLDDDDEVGEASTLTRGDNDAESELSPGAENYKADDPLSELSPENLEAMDDQEDDYPVDLLESEDDQTLWGEGVSCMGSLTVTDQQSKSTKDGAMEKQLQSQVPSG